MNGGQRVVEGGTVDGGWMADGGAVLVPVGQRRALQAGAIAALLARHPGDPGTAAGFRLPSRLGCRSPPALYTSGCEEYWGPLDKKCGFPKTRFLSRLWVRFQRDGWVTRTSANASRRCLFWGERFLFLG